MWGMIVEFCACVPTFNGHEGVCEGVHTWVSELAHVCVCSHEQFWRPELYRIIIVEPKPLELFVHSLAPKKVKKMCFQMQREPHLLGMA